MMQGPRWQQQGDAFLAVLDIAVCHMDSVYNLIQISAVNKRCRAICALHANHQLQALLLPVLRQLAAKPYGPLRQQQIGCTEWLCRAASKNAFAAASDAITAIPGVPFAAAHLLAAAGVRVSDAAVMAAALEQQPGAGDWMLAKIAVHGVTKDEDTDVAELFALSFSAEETAAVAGCSVAEAAVQPRFLLELMTICTNAEESLLLQKMMFVMHPSRTANMLRFAVNLPCDTPASAAVAYLHELSEEVHAALQQEHARLTKHFRQPHLQHMEIVQTALKNGESHVEKCLQRRQQQQQQITPQLLEELLLLAAARHHYALMLQLLELRPASQQLPSSAVEQLLNTLICSKLMRAAARDALVPILCELPAAAGLSAVQLARIVRKAVDRQQLCIVGELCCLLELRDDFDSELACQVLMPVVCSSWFEGLEWMEQRGVLHVLQPRQTSQLLRQALLTATLAGAGMQPAWCDAAARKSSSSSNEQAALPAELAVLKLLYSNGAASELNDSQKQRLLLTAAALGNAGALALLFSLQGEVDYFVATVDQLLQYAVQFRSRAMLQLVVSLLLLPDMAVEISWDTVTEHALTSLLRAGDLPQMMQSMDDLAAARHDLRSGSDQGVLLAVAGQLGRCSSIRALCSKQNWWVVNNKQSRITSKALEALLRLAERKNSPSTVQCLLQQPVQDIEAPDSLLLQFAEEEKQRRQALRAAAAEQRQSCTQQQQQLGGWQQRPHPAPQLDLDAAALFRAMQAGHLPDGNAHAMLPVATVSGTMMPEPADLKFYDDFSVAAPQLLAAALQLPPGQQQQAWLELLYRSQLVAYMKHMLVTQVSADLFVVAVHAAYAHNSCDALRMLCSTQTLRRLKGRDLYHVVAAAVQVGYLPAVQLLLREWPAAQSLKHSHVSALLRWVMSSGNGSRSAASSTLDDNELAVYTHNCQPEPPSDSPGRVELLRLLFKLPAAQQIPLRTVVGLLMYAMQQGSVEAVQQLCKLDAAAGLNTQAIRGLLRWARVVGSRPARDAVVGALCGLKGASGLKAAVVGDLLQLYDGADALMGWAAAESEQAGVEPAEVRLTCIEG